HRRSTFDRVASLSVEGLNKSAIARVNRISWNTVHRWLQRAAACCRRFNDRKIKRLSGVELQADEIRTIVGSKEQPIWVFVVRFKFYERIIGRVFGPACVYGQVIKTRRNDRIVKVERRVVIGAGRLKEALRNSEDSAKLNTSFVERLNLTIRQNSSYLRR